MKVSLQDFKEMLVTCHSTQKNTMKASTTSQKKLENPFYNT